VSLENRPPVFASRPDVTIPEGEILSLTLNATDPDGDALTYQLGPGAPPGALLNASSGQLNWVTAETHGPGTNLFTLLARDSGLPSLTSTQTFRVIVLESNLPPVLAPITDFSMGEGRLLSFTNQATDPDLPAQRLAFSLAAGAPAGATLHPDTGVFTWRPADFQGGTNYLISVIVRDDAAPSLTATQSFTVAVLDTRVDFQLLPGTAAFLPGTVGSLPLQLNSGATLEEVTVSLMIASDRLADIVLTELAPQVGAADLVPLGAGRYQARFTSRPGQWLQGNFPLARIGFRVTPGAQSEVAKVLGESVTGLRIDGLTVNGQGREGRVFIVGAEPMLDIQYLGEQVGLTLYALPGKPWMIEQASAMSASGPWSLVTTVTPIALRTDLPPQSAAAPDIYYRARSATNPTLLSIRSEGDQVVLEWSLDCVGCVLLQSPVLGTGAVWTPAFEQPQVVGNRYRVTMPAGGIPLFLRLQTAP
jgi:hypothetical protein